MQRFTISISGDLYAPSMGDRPAWCVYGATGPQHVRGTNQSGHICSHSTWSRHQYRPTRADCCKPQGQPDELRQVSWHAGGQRGAHPLWHKRQHTCTPKEAVHQLWGCNHPLHDQTPPQENSDQDDDLPEVRLQIRGLQKALGSNDEHHGLLHWP